MRSAMKNINQFIEEQIDAIRKTVGRGKVLCALSGGVDSAVTALLVHRAVGDKLLCMFIDSGLMRKGEPEEVASTFGRHFGIPNRRSAMKNKKQFIEEQIDPIRKTVGRGKVLCALSGGVDSAFTALLVHRAVGDKLLCMFIDSGLMRKGEPEEVASTFGRHFGIPLQTVR